MKQSHRQHAVAVNRDRKKSLSKVASASTALSLLALGCGGAPSEQEETTAVQRSPVLGPTTYAPECLLEAGAIDLAYAYARIAVNAPAFAECLQRAFYSNVVWTPLGFGTMNIGPYIPCASDPPTPGPATILTSVRTANPTKIACDISQLGTTKAGYAGIGGVPANDPITSEAITLGSALGMVAGGGPCFASPTGTCIPEQAFAEVGATIIHEVMHQHGYNHFEYGDPPFLCGIPADKHPSYANSVNYQVGECIRVVLEESIDHCSLHSCPQGGLRLQDSLFGNQLPSCSCISDPKQPGNPGLTDAVTPLCRAAGWTCRAGNVTEADIACDPPLPGTHFQLYRQVPTGYTVAPTTVTAAGAGQVTVSELGYEPSASEDSLTYKVCAIADVLKACSQPIVLNGTTDECLPHIDWIGTTHGPVAGGNGIKIEGDGFESCPQRGPSANMQVFFQRNDGAGNVLEQVQAPGVDCQDTKTLFTVSPAVRVAGPWDIVVTAYGKTSPRSLSDRFTYTSGPELAAFSYVWQSGTAVGTVSLDGTAPVAITVALSSDDPSAIAVPTSVTIPAGATKVSFPMPGPGTFWGTIVRASLDGYTVSVGVVIQLTCGTEPKCRTGSYWDPTQCACVACRGRSCM